MTEPVTIQVDPNVYASIQRCIAERDAGMAQAAAADRGEWDRRLVDQAIDVFAGTGLPFSANDLRPLLPAMPGQWIGPRFDYAARHRRVITKVGPVASNLPTTHKKDIAEWIGTNPSE